MSDKITEDDETLKTELEDTVIFDSETSSDIPNFLMDTLPAGNKDIGDESSKTHVRTWK